MTAGDSTTLAELQPGEHAVVKAVGVGLGVLERRRLLELGIFPGTRIEAVFDSPLRDPMAYRVRGLTVALRDSQARHVEIRRGD